MKKYLLLVLLAFTAMFTLAGCDKRKVVGEWELIGVSYNAEEITVREFLKAISPDYDDAMIENEYTFFMYDTTLRFNKDKTGMLGMMDFTWEYESGEIEGEFQNSYLDDFEAVLTKDRLYLEIDFYDLGYDITLIYEKK